MLKYLFEQESNGGELNSMTDMMNTVISSILQND